MHETSALIDIALIQMQLFIRNIPSSTREEDLKISIARHIHRPPFRVTPPLNFNVRLWRGKPNANFRFGLLTLPDEATGELFLSVHGQKGILLENGLSRIQFSRNNKPPDNALISQVAANDWVDPSALRKAEEERKSQSTEIRLKAFAFGRLCRDGTFSAEVRREGTCTIACDVGNRRVRLTVDGDGLFTMSCIAWYRASQILAMSRSDPTLEQHALIIEANGFPIFEEPPLERPEIVNIPGNVRAPPSQRVESIFGNDPMPSVGRLLCLTFGGEDDLSLFTQRCRKQLHLRNPSFNNIPIVHYELYSERVEAKCQDVLRRLPFTLAYELHKAISSGVLDPVEVVEVEPAVQTLHDERPMDAPAILRWFLTRVQAPSLSNLGRSSLKQLRNSFTFFQKKKRNRRQRGAKARARARQQPPPSVEAELEECTLSDLLALAAKAYAPENPRMNKLVTPTPDIYESYHLILTPSSLILEGPLPDQSSSILRRFGNHECFLRVTFQDSNRSTLRQDMALNLSIKDLLETRYKRTLLRGITVAGRHFEFLGYSMSGLKQHSVFFVHPFEYDMATGRTMMTAEVIRGELGDFSRIAKKPALLAARWAQLFSASAPSVTLNTSEVRRIPDRQSSSGSVFTDGCSPISPELARAIWNKLGGRRGVMIPSAFQIRVGGAKGVIFQDPTLHGRLLCLRPSQTKFETENELTLDISTTSARPIPLFLNRPLTMLLSHLGVKDAALIKLQNDAINDVDETRTSFLAASKLFQQHGLGASFRLPSLFNNMVRQLRLSDDDVTPSILSCNMISTVIADAATHVLREIKFRGRIAVPGSYTLIGVSDEWQCLREREIYATVRDEKTQTYVQIEGPVLVTRSPQIHPGDVQFVTAVRRPQLAHLNNVVVFSCEGDRSLPSCLGGGDLDGDIFNIVMDPSLFPTRTVEAGSYKGLPHKETAEACTVSDIADFVINFLEADLVGTIATRHLCIADQSEQGPECDDCLKLAEYASHAVDFPKTGTPVDFTQLPRGPNRLKPDFLSTEATDTDMASANSSFYPSQKVLGKLYRRVPLRENEQDRLDGSFGPVIMDALRRLKTSRLGLPSIYEVPEDIYQEMSELMDLYKSELEIVAKANTLSKHPNEQLTEAELLSGTIQAKWSDHRKRRETVADMNLQTTQLTKAVRRELRKVNLNVEVADMEDDDGDEDDDEDRLSNRDIESFVRAAGAWMVAVEDLGYEEEQEGGASPFGAASFGIIALGVMLDVVKKARQVLS